MAGKDSQRTVVLRIHALDGRYDLHVRLCTVRQRYAKGIAARRTVLDQRSERPELPSDPRDLGQEQLDAVAEDRRISGDVCRHLGGECGGKHVLYAVRDGWRGTAALAVEAV